MLNQLTSNLDVATIEILSRNLESGFIGQFKFIYERNVRMNKKYTLLIALLLIVSLVLVACGGGAPAAPAAQAPAGDAPTAPAGDAPAPPAGDDSFVVGLAMNTLANPFFVDVRDGVQRSAAELGIDLRITDSQEDPAAQLRDVENLLTMGLDAIILNPVDSDAIVAAVEAANAVGVPVFTVDRQSNGGDVVAHIGFDAIRSGNLAGQFLVDALGGEGYIVELQGIMGTNVAQDRSRGFNEIMDANTGMTIVAQQIANFNRAEGMSVMETILVANPRIDGLYAANDEMLMGALEAIEAAGRGHEIVMIGCDAIDDVVAAIKEGRVDATIAEPPFFLGRAIMDTVWDYLHGASVERLIVMENNLVTPDNVYDLVTRN